ncbi:heparinase II/III family protein [Devosia sediminis]|uniref:Alginate lyase family protein n=1 Tax=Devosia sediminis TaxID=2798801 RepID=A0A934MIM9_9HYPH|nr:alginate lyase family protein [Devosia sediminis]MBJ3783123.1 alginate lyase family protein [Devosia sediminis]
MRKLQKLRWMVNRLGSMSAPEIVHRVRERRLRKAGRAAGGWSRYAVAEFELVCFPVDDAQLRALAADCAPDWRSIEQQARTGRWHYLGMQWPGAAAGAAWHLDPVSGAAWPSDRYCFDIDFRHGAGRGDIKYVWEINRLQFLPPIAARARAEGDDAAARYCIDTILDWAEANPPFLGVNWASGIELALRAISILLTLSLVGPDRLAPDERLRIGALLNAHAVWLMRYPSLFSSANNHLVAEAAGLYILGALVPSLPGADRYRAYGRQVLVEEAGRQILADGVGAEQTPTYTAFTLELYAFALVAARAAGEDFPDQVRTQLGKAVDFLRWVTDGKGNQPRFGDDDEGRVAISLAGPERHYVASVMSGVAALSARPDSAPPMAPPHLRDLFLGKATAGSQPPQGLRSFDDGGYSVFRAQLAGRETMLAFDHGPLGYLSIAAHGHADALAIWLHVDGQPVIVDAGTYLYHSGGAERDRFRGTAAHNTLEINGTNQSTIVGAFNWSHKARAWRLPEAGEELAVAARHDGYSRPFGVVHERRVAQAPGGFTVTDSLAGPLTAVADTVLRLYLDPSITAQRDAEGRVALSRDGKALMHLTFETSTGSALAAELLPTEVSPSFGAKEPSTVITLAVPKSAWSEGGGVVTGFQVFSPAFRL